MAVKGLIAAIVQFLNQQLKNDDITADCKESLEVAIQCLENAYNVQASHAPTNFNLYEIYKSSIENVNSQTLKDTSEAKAEAERLKNEGNALLKAEKYHEALANYTKAIQLDSRNAIYYCNRAATYSKIGNHQQAIEDCHTALLIDPSYSKAYVRLGFAYLNLKKYKEAKESYQKALEMEPDNESYKNNLEVAENKLAQQGISNIELGGEVFPGMDIASYLNSPALLNTIHQMSHDPAVQNMVSNFMSGYAEQGGHVDALREAGQQFARQFQNSNPDLFESVRQRMEENPNDSDPPQKY